MEYVNYEVVEENIGIITLNRPKALNALNNQVLDEISETLKQIDQKVIRCVILTGTGDKAFAAGADIGAMAEYTAEQGKDFCLNGNHCFYEIEHFPLPIIAAVNGFALGGGNELAMSCDIRYCSDNAVFGQPEVGLGIIPGFGGTQRLAKCVGSLSIAKEMIYAAKNIKADEAKRIGLVSEIYPQAELMDAALKTAKKIARMAPVAIRAAKKAINEGFNLKADAGIDIEAKYFVESFDTEDRVEGMKAFVEKRKDVKFQNK